MVHWNQLSEFNAKNVLTLKIRIQKRLRSRECQTCEYTPGRWEFFIYIYYGQNSSCDWWF